MPAEDLGNGIGAHAPVIVIPLAVPTLDRSMDCPVRVRFVLRAEL